MAKINLNIFLLSIFVGTVLARKHFLKHVSQIKLRLILAQKLEKKSSAQITDHYDYTIAGSR